MKWKRQSSFIKFWELGKKVSVYLFHQKLKETRMDTEKGIAEQCSGGVLMDSNEMEEATEFVEQRAEHHFLLPFLTIFLYLVDVGII